MPLHFHQKSDNDDDHSNFCKKKSNKKLGWNTLYGISIKSNSFLASLDFYRLLILTFSNILDPFRF